MRDRLLGIVLKILTRGHLWLYRRSGGRLARRFLGRPTLLLTTRGRRSGRRHTVPLLYIEDDGDFIVAGSAGGWSRHPAWWLNLRAHSEAEVEIEGRRIPVRASPVGADERPRLWRALNDLYSGYERYRRRTRREIPIARLRPVTARTPGR